MKPQLNHLIVWTKDRHAAAELMADVLGAGPTTEWGHFTQIETGNGVALDFADTDEDPSGSHLAFLVTERQFDEIFARIQDLDLPYWADPLRSRPDEINHHDGGRGVYFGDPHTAVGWEIITRPYGSGPVDG
ncbi:MAG: VOC family protein [Actinomycetota bacterium]